MFVRLCILCVLVVSLSSQGEIIYVDADSGADGDGRSWATAYCELTPGLQRATFGDEVWIAAGVYFPTSSTDREATFSVTDGIRVYGGFQGMENDREERNPALYITILDGNIGDPLVREDNVERVVTAIEVGVDTVIDGLTIRNAYNDFGDGEEQGGGIFAQRASFQLTNCTIRNNRAGGGGGLWNEDGDPHIERCAFYENYSSAITHLGGSPLIYRCYFEQNEANGRGGAYNASTKFHNASFLGCVFFRNDSGARGGVYYGVGHPTFEGCLFLRNKAGSAGGIAYLHEGLSTFTNCVGYDNYSDFHAGGVQTHTDDSVLAVTNCIFWGNTSKHTTGERNQINPRGEGQLNYCCVEGWTGEFGGVGNFGDDPRFIDPGRGNLRLREDSPCYDAGDDAAVTQKVDLDGHPRILGDRVDLGCYELLCPAILSLKASCTSGGKLKAVVRTTLPEGATVRVRQGEGKSREATVKRNGKAVAKWRPDEEDTGPICPEGCTAPLCAEDPCP
ncbi:MAG: hypothetical protein FLDDKLPJ_01926 [Phycisphaerae bacterium]|nr:hypothetical protein [Phycisphaerae bacterium]